MTTRPKSLLAAALAAALTVSGVAAHAQPYPTKPVRIVVKFPPGGVADLIGRALGAKLQEALGQPFVVEAAARRTLPARCSTGPSGRGRSISRTRAPGRR